MKITRCSPVLALTLALFSVSIHSASAQSELLNIEFVEDDQEGFTLWPSEIAGNTTSADFTTDASLTSGTTTVTVTASTFLSVPANRLGAVDGEPAGFSFNNLYADLLHASGPTGVITVSMAGLTPNTAYEVTLYAWDPGSTDGTDKVWDVTAGTGVPATNSVNFLDELVDNESFALVYTITTTSEGELEITNTGGLAQSAINGFRLVALGDSVAPGGLDITGFGFDPDLDEVALTWNSVAGVTYNVRYSSDLIDWTNTVGTVTGDTGTSTSRVFNLASSGIPSSARLFFRVEEE